MPVLPYFCLNCFVSLGNYSFLWVVSNFRDQRDCGWFESMQSESETANRLVNLHSIRPSTICSEPWWRTGFNSSSVEHINDGVGPKDSQSQSNGAPVDSAVKEPQTILSPRSGIINLYTISLPLGKLL